MLKSTMTVFLLVALVGCAVVDQDQPAGRAGKARPVAQRVVAQFVGQVDPSSGKLSVQMRGDSKIKLATDGVGVLRRTLADEQLTEWKDGDPTCNDTFSTVDLVTNTASLGSSTCESDSGQSSWGGQVSVGNYYVGEYLCNVWAIITEISDPAHAACDAPDRWPTMPGHLAATYGAIYMGHTFSPFDGSCPRDSLTGWRNWQFKDDSGSAFTFTGQIWADRQSTPCGPETTIEGLDIDIDGANSGFYHVPPDPIGAAGPNHLVSVTNTSIEWHTKGGTQQNSQSLASFFSSLSPAGGTFDPKVIYDQYEGRFLVVALDKNDLGENDPSNASSIFLAVSQTSDPNGGWYFVAIDAKEDIDDNDHWVDYPGFSVGDSAVYITGMMFRFTEKSFGGSRLWIVDKGTSGGFYGGGTASATVHDPPGVTGSLASVLQPAHMFGTPPTNVGTFLVMYSGLSAGNNEYLSIIRVDDPVGTPTFSQQYLNVGNIDDQTDMPDAPQSGTAVLIETNDRRTLNAVWRDNSLWTTAQVMPASGGETGQVTAHWFQLSTANLSAITVTQQGNVGGEDIATGAYTFMPSIMVDQSGNMALAFSASAPSIFAGAYYVGRYATDSAGITRASHTLATGAASYVRTFGGSRNRWGDYSGIALDPNDESTFWVFNEYASTRGTLLDGEDGRWGTRFGSFSILMPKSP